MRLLLTGGAGFIGCNLARKLLARGDSVVLLDAFTYAGHEESLRDIAEHPELSVHRGDVSRREDVDAAFAAGPFDGVLHLAAESHVDRSIHGPDAFVHTNVLGTHTLLEGMRRAAAQWSVQPRFLLVSTDEVYGSLGAEGRFTEDSPLQPSSPYSASKASADLLALAAARSFELDVVVTRCSNNYGPYQLPEKLIPLMVLRALRGEVLPVYGDGQQVRDWIHVDDHCEALLAVLDRGRSGAVYNIGADTERANLEVVQRILALVGADAGLIRHVKDRPAHDRRYAMDASRLRRELEWAPAHDFESGLADTVRWYRENDAWCRAVTGDAYEAFMRRQYE